MLSIIVVLLVVGLVLWAVKALPFIDDTIKRIITIVVIVCVALWLLRILFGADLGSLPSIR